LRVQVDVPGPPEMLLGLQLAVSPDGEVEVERFTVPVNPFRPDTVVVKEPLVPVAKETLDGLVEMLKSCWPESLQAVTGCISQPL